MNNHLLSVLVSSYNNAGHLDRCLRAVKETDHSRYELVVVDDGSGDSSFETAKRYTDKAFRLEQNMGRSAARNACVSFATGDILVFVDADVCIRPDTLRHIEEYFLANEEAVAVTGLLSRTHFNPDFFSQYKNLYMNYIFSQLPDEVTFLYGSIHAIRASAFLPYGDVVDVADDTALGQKLASLGYKIGFSKKLEVVHLKKYSCAGFFRNDFIIPYDMGQIFVRFKGWKQLGKHRTGFVHSSPSQLLSVAICVLLPLASLFFWRWSRWPVIATLFGLGWLLLNFRFFRFLSKEKGLRFAALGVLVTFPDHIVMAAGIAAGISGGCWKFVLRPLFREGQREKHSDGSLNGIVLPAPDDPIDDKMHQWEQQ